MWCSSHDRSEGWIPKELFRQIAVRDARMYSYMYVTRVYSYVTRMYSYVTRMYKYVTRMYSYVTRMYSYITRMYS